MRWWTGGGGGSGEVGDAGVAFWVGWWVGEGGRVQLKVL